mgnify:CR=1 FL=1
MPFRYPLDLDVGNGDARIALTVAVELLIALTTLLVEDEHLLSTHFAIDSSLNGTLYKGCANGYLAIVRSEEDVSEFDRLTGLLFEQRYSKRLLRCHGDLCASDFDDCVHGV